MATTVTSSSMGAMPSAPARQFVFTVNFDENYATGGVSNTAIKAALEGQTVLWSPHEPHHDGVTKRYFKWDSVASKIFASTDDAGATEVANATALGAHNTALVVVFCH